MSVPLRRIGTVSVWGRLLPAYQRPANPLLACADGDVLQTEDGPLYLYAEAGYWLLAREIHCEDYGGNVLRTRVAPTSDTSILTGWRIPVRLGFSDPVGILAL